MIFGLCSIKDTVKPSEARALTDVKVFCLPRDKFLPILARHRKVRYYCKRWVTWELVRRFIKTYARLYHVACLRGGALDPPIISRRGEMTDEQVDDVDLTVLEHIAEHGY